jgi:hypothetical protein
MEGPPSGCRYFALAEWLRRGSQSIFHAEESSSDRATRGGCRFGEKDTINASKSRFLVEDFRQPVAGST